MRTTVGMATFEDFDGVAFTLESIRLHHGLRTPKDVELIVIDNSPNTPSGEMTRDFLNGINGAFPKETPLIKYVPFAENSGTSVARNLIFEHATGEIVWGLDCHVLPALGSFPAVESWLSQETNRKDLVSGPLIMDDLLNFTTHYDDRWRGEMWGTWGAAWRCKCGRTTFGCVDKPPTEPGKPGETSGGVVHYVTLSWPQQEIDICTKCRSPLEHIPWPGHEAVLMKAGHYRLGSSLKDEPFEIPGMGLGMYACRRDAWPGFNPHARNFGGEELYIHEKVRRNGGKVVCIPAAPWWHRFGRPAGVKYRNPTHSKVRNYVLEFQELRLPERIEETHGHFVKELGKMSQTQWDYLLADPMGREKEEAIVTVVQNGGCLGNDTIDGLYRKAKDTPSDINEHCATLRALAEQCEHVTEFGMRHGVSTIAILAGGITGKLKTFRSYDVNPNCAINSLVSLVPDVFRFVQGSSLAVEIDGTDMLFIDTKHTAQQLYGELTRHAPKVRKWIAMHDTVIFGEQGEDGTPGLLPALRRFMRENPEWSVVKHYTNNYGLTVISRLKEERPPLPSKLTMAVNLGKAVAAHVVTGAKSSPVELMECRLAICSLCEMRNENNCSVCGCGIADKASWLEQECPLGKWSACTPEALVQIKDDLDFGVN